MKRLAPLLILTPLFGCVEFLGENERLGFFTELTLGPQGPWTPEHFVAGGSETRVGAVRVDREDEEGAVYEGSVSGDLEVLPDEEGLRLKAAERGRGSVRFDGPTWDRFAVELAPARGFAVHDVARWLLDEEALGPVALVPGAEVTLLPEVLDWRGRALGYNPEQLEVEAEGAVSAWLVDGALVVSADGEAGGGGEVRVSLGGRPLGGVEVELVDVEQQLELELARLPLEEDEVVWVALATLEDGTPVLGLEPRWEGAEPEPGERGDVAFSGPEAEVRVFRPARR